MARRVHVLNGPNLNLLGTRQTEVYGETTLAEVEESCVRHGESLGLAVSFRQTNHEGVLVDWVQEAGVAGEPIVLNPGAYSHTSVALLDAISGTGAVVVEVHISNIFARERFRRHSYVSPVAAGIIAGLGTRGYLLALDAVAAMSDG
jgi:3-dehydroquinate dehydratase-2